MKAEDIPLSPINREDSKPYFMLMKKGTFVRGEFLSNAFYALLRRKGNLQIASFVHFEINVGSIEYFNVGNNPKLLMKEHNFLCIDKYNFNVINIILGEELTDHFDEYGKESLKPKTKLFHGHYKSMKQSTSRSTEHT